MTRIRTDSGIYHCVSRVNGRLRLLDPPEVREQFVRMLAKVAGFCSMDVLSFCVMGNHFHVLVRERPVEPGSLGDAALRDKLALLYGPQKGRILFDWQQSYRRNGMDGRADEIAEQYRRMMGEVSAFMKLLKQRFSVWYNRSHGRRGTLWEERFRSVAVEESAGAVRMMAAYIELNPVRAGIVRDPAAYRWSSYGAGCGGLEFARRALGTAYGIALGEGGPEGASNGAGGEGGEAEGERVRAWWSLQMALEGEEVRDEQGRVVRRGLDAELVALVGGESG